MTGDARGEAERIVGEYGQLAYEWGCANTDPKRSQGPAQDAWASEHERLVAALAAAIEVAEQHTLCAHADAGTTEQCPECRLIAAVTPLLRARTGEGTDGR